MSSERGSAAVELVLVAPILVALMGLIGFLGQLTGTRADLEAAARDAARAGSLARSPIGAEAAGRAAADADLTSRPCDEVAVAVDTSRFSPGGSVTVDLGCRVSGPMGGNRWLRASFTEQVDPFRGVAR